MERCVPRRVRTYDADDPVRRLIDRYRTQCLWFLRRDYYPATDAARERVLRLIARHGDLRAFRRVAEVRAWLSHRSSGTSADCWRTDAAAPATATEPEAPR